MLLNLHKKSWMDGLSLQDFDTHCSTNENTVKVWRNYIILYKLLNKWEYS